MTCSLHANTLRDVVQVGTRARRITRAEPIRRIVRSKLANELLTIRPKVRSLAEGPLHTRIAKPAVVEHALCRAEAAVLPAEAHET